MGRIARNILPVLIAVAALPLAFSQIDKPGSKDYPGVTQMPGYDIDNYKESQFDSCTFTGTNAGNDRNTSVEGHVFKYEYRLLRGATGPAPCRSSATSRTRPEPPGDRTLWETGCTLTLIT